MAGDGTGSLVAEWGHQLPERPRPTVESFQLPAPVAHACVDPLSRSRVAFGGLENDVKVYDLDRKEVLWSAKNVREDSLCLRVPVKVTTLSWATKMCPARSLITRLNYAKSL